MRYVHLASTDGLPGIDEPRPCKAIVVLEESVSSDRRAEISRWLVASGCLYVMTKAPEF